MTSFLSLPWLMCVYVFNALYWMGERAQRRRSETWASENADRKSFLSLNFTISQTRLPSGAGAAGHPALPWSYVAFLPAQPAGVELCRRRLFCAVARWLICALQKHNPANEVELFELIPLPSEMLTDLSSLVHFNFETPLGLFLLSESPRLCLSLP